MKKINFTVVIEKDPQTKMYVGEVPGMQGAHSQGETLDELMANMKEVIQLCLETKKGNFSHLPTVVGIQNIEVTA